MWPEKYPEGAGDRERVTSNSDSDTQTQAYPKVSRKRTPRLRIPTLWRTALENFAITSRTSPTILKALKPKTGARTVSQEEKEVTERTQPSSISTEQTESSTESPQAGEHKDSDRHSGRTDSGDSSSSFFTGSEAQASTLTDDDALTTETGTLLQTSGSTSPTETKTGTNKGTQFSLVSE